MRLSRRQLLAGAAGAATLAVAAPGRADIYPSRTIRIIVGFAPGAATDISARIVADAISVTLGKPVIVENKAGAGSMIAAEYVARAEPDGYTLFQTTSGGLSVLPAVKPGVPYRPESFSYISRLIKQAQVLALNARLPIASMADFIAYARANPPETLRAGTAGAGGIPDLTTALLGLEIGAQILRVPYSGSSANLNAVLSGEVDFSFLSPPTVLALAREGKIRMLAHTGPARDPLWADVPTMAESGLPRLTVENYFGLLGPAKLPPAILERLRAAVAEALADPKVRERFARADLEPAPLVGDAFQKLATAEYQSWLTVAKTARITVD